MNRLKSRVRPEQIRELSLLVLIVAAIVTFGSFIDGYYSFRTFNRIASSVAIITVVAVGQTLVVLTRNIDLSVGSIVGFTAYFVGTLIANHNGINPLLAVAIAIAMGAALGVVNGVIVAWGRVPAVVVTLGTLAIYRGVLVDLSGAKTVTTDSLPDWLTGLPLVNVAPIGNLDIRPLFVLALVIVVIFQFATTYLSFARRFYAIGSNPEAAQLIGLPIRGVVFLAFVVCGALAGLAGFMFLVRFGNITVYPDNVMHNTNLTASWLAKWRLASSMERASGPEIRCAARRAISGPVLSDSNVLWRIPSRSQFPPCPRVGLAAAGSILRSISTEREGPRSVHVPLLRQEEGEAGALVDFDLHQRDHRLTPARVDGILSERIHRLFKILRLEIAKQRKPMAKDRIVADSGLLQRIHHLRPDLVMALLVFLFVAGPHLEHPCVLPHALSSLRSEIVVDDPACDQGEVRAPMQPVQHFDHRQAVDRGLHIRP